VGREEAVASTTVRRPEQLEEGIKPMVVEPLNIVSRKFQDVWRALQPDICIAKPKPEEELGISRLTESLIDRDMV
jgi:hypothetical protein